MAFKLAIEIQKITDDISIPNLDYFYYIAQLSNQFARKMGFNLIVKLPDKVNFAVKLQNF